MNKNENIRLFSGIIIPLVFILIMWTVKSYEFLFNEDFSEFGIVPKSISGLKGIFCTPFLHADFAHLISNTLPFFLLGSSLFYFYKKIAYKVFLFIWILPGIWVWLAARDAYHIGASGMVYGFASFLFFSGLIHRVKSLIAVSFTVVFIYGSMFWGVFPVIEGMSWESHLFGAIVGFLLSLFYAGQFPMISVSQESPLKQNMEFDSPEITDNKYTKVRYHLKSTPKKKKDLSQKS
jgi:membrane associated rhomboid family serine protease